MGKGSGRRPLLISEQEAEDNWNRIFKKNNIVLTPEEECSIDTIEALIEIQKEKEQKRTEDPIQKPFPHNILRQSRMDVIGQNGNNGDHYEYELNKSTGEVEKRFRDGFEKPNGDQFGD